MEEEIKTPVPYRGGFAYTTTTSNAVIRGATTINCRLKA